MQELLRLILERRYLFIIGLFALGIGIPLGKSFMSIGVYVLAGSCLVDGLYRADFHDKWRRFTKNKAALALMVIYLIHLLGLVHTHDMAAGLKDIYAKSAIPVLALVFSAMRPMQRDEYRFVLYTHLAAVLLCTALNYFHLSGLDETLGSVRGEMRFISHVRLSLVIVSAICMGMLVLKKEGFLAIVLYGMSCVWLIYFMTRFQLGTGLVLLILALPLTMYLSLTNPWRKWAAVLSIAGALLCGVWLWGEYSAYNKVQADSRLNNEERTAKGNFYNKVNSHHIEHNNYIWSYWSKEELRRAWAMRLRVSETEMDINLEARLIRYLNALGLRKDAEGLAALSDEDIGYIVAGRVQPPEMDLSGLDARMQAILYELSGYQAGADPSGNSITQRLEYWRAALGIWKSNLLFGVGTGDLRSAFDEEYESNGTKLQMDYRHLAHNQYLSFALILGLAGFVLFLLSFFYPLMGAYKSGKHLFVITFFIIALSCLTEDTLESQDGLYTYLFYSGLFYFLQPINEENP